MDREILDWRLHYTPDMRPEPPPTVPITDLMPIIQWERFAVVCLWRGAKLPPDLLPSALAFTPRAPRFEPGDPDFPEALRLDGLDHELPRVAFYSSRPEHYLVLAAIYGEPAAAAVWWAARVENGTAGLQIRALKFQV